MAKKVITVVLVFIAVLFFNGNCLAIHIGIIIKDNTPVFKYPNNDYYKLKESQNILFELNVGKVVKLIEVDSYWYRIEYKNKSGWVLGENLRKAIVYPKSITSEEGEINLNIKLNETSITPVYTSKIENVNFCMPSWSPDGKTVAVIKEYYHIASGDGPPKITDSTFLCLLDIRSHKMKKVFKGLIFDPRWSPDGSKLLFSNKGVISYLDVYTGEIVQIVTVQSDEYGPYIGNPQWINDDKVAYLISYYETFGTLYQYSIQNQTSEKIGGNMQDYIVIKNGQKVFGYNMQSEYSDGVSASIVDLNSKAVVIIPYNDLPFYDKNPFWQDSILKVFDTRDILSSSADNHKVVYPTQFIYSLNEEGRVIEVDTMPRGLFRGGSLKSKWSNNGKYIVSIIVNDLWLISTETFEAVEILDKGKHFAHEKIDYTNRLPFGWSPTNKQFVFCLNENIYKVQIK